MNYKICLMQHSGRAASYLLLLSLGFALIMIDSSYFLQLDTMTTDPV